MWPVVIKVIVWVFKIATENFIGEYAKKQADKVKYKFKTKSTK